MLKKNCGVAFGHPTTCLCVWPSVATFCLHVWLSVAAFCLCVWPSAAQSLFMPRFSLPLPVLPPHSKLIYVLKYYVQEGENLVDDDKKRDSQESRRTELYDRRSMGRRSGEEKDLGRRVESMEVREVAGAGEQEKKKEETQETLQKAMKCLPYIFRFIIRSRELFEK